MRKILLFWVRIPVTCYVTAGRTKRLNIDPYFDSVCTWRQSALSSVLWSTFVVIEVTSGPFMAVHHRGNLYCTSGGDSAPVKRSISWDQQLLKHSHKKQHMTQICPFFSLYSFAVILVVRNKQPLTDSTRSLPNTMKIYKHAQPLSRHGAFRTTKPSNSKTTPSS